MTIRRIVVTVAVLTAVASGAYVFLYLYRWEWNRALMAGVVFIGAEVALLGIAIIDRLRRLDQRLKAIERGIDHDQMLTRIKESAPAQRRHFAWLSESEGGMGVFVPVLMGAGVVISVLAWGVERLAQKTGRPVLERRLAGRLSSIALPEPGAEAPVSTARRRPAAFRLAGQLLLAAALAGSIFALAGATQNRPDEIRAGTSSIVSLDVFTVAGVDRAAAAESLWQSCAGTVPNRINPDRIRVHDGTAVSLRLQPALGTYGERRLRGCLQDTTLDRIQAAVRRVKHVLNP